tara:strand:+ start:236 stop:397 length:162 start_codon:yes stop_codon:yes gene_type:complete
MQQRVGLARALTNDGDILLTPQTQYVKDFVEDVNRARVIKAKHIMSEINGQEY